MENNTHNNDNLGTKQPSQEDGKMAANNNEEDAHRREQVDNPNDFNSETVTQGDEEEEEAETRSNLDQPNRSSSRTPFTNLSQIDADLALARTLQEQVITPFSFFVCVLILILGVFFLRFNIRDF